ncbi:MAG: riboflavin synthase [Gemmatimonadaceae bacterium]
MFTGLVDDVGVIAAVAPTSAGVELEIRCAWTDLVIGESVACNGACLTVRECGPGWFKVAAVVTTQDRTTIGTWDSGRRVNLERALTVGDRLGGHIVQGHVDGVGAVVATHRRADAWLIEIAVTGDIDELLVPHGSVTVDGVSLTVNALPAAGRLEVSLIEHTLRHTTLGDLRPGDRVHVESDVLGKYVRRLLRRPQAD